MRAYNGMKWTILAKTNNTEKQREEWVSGEVKYHLFEATVGSSNFLFSLFSNIYRHKIGYIEVKVKTRLMQIILDRKLMKSWKI